MSTVTDLLAEFDTFYPECSSARALVYFNKVHQEFATRSQFRNKLEMVTVTAGVAEYDMPAGVSMIHESYWMESADPSTWFPLVDRSLDEYIVKRWGWRLTQADESQPTEIYTTSAVSSSSSKGRMGVWMTPNETSVAGYPCVGMYVTSVVDLVGADSLPPQIINNNMYLYGMSKLWCAEQKPDELPRWMTLAEVELNKNVDHIKGLQVHKQDEVLSFPTLRQSRNI